MFFQQSDQAYNQRHFKTSFAYCDETVNNQLFSMGMVHFKIYNTRRRTHPLTNIKSQMEWDEFGCEIRKKSIKDINAVYFPVLYDDSLPAFKIVIV